MSHKWLLSALVVVAAVVGIIPTAVAQNPQQPPVTAVGNLGRSDLDVGLGAPGGSAQSPRPDSSGSGSVQVVPVSTGSGSGSGSGSGGSGSSSGPQSPPPITWVRNYYSSDSETPGYRANQPILCPAGSTRAYEDVGTDRATGVVVARQHGCEQPGAPTQPGSGAVTARPEPPPPPPTAAEIWARVPLPAPRFGVNPAINGLTGLDTFLWDPDAGPRTATVTLRGYTAQASAQAVRWTWRMSEPGEPGPASRSNPNPVVQASTPGSRDTPAATYMYETKGDYTLTATVMWSGTYSYSGNGQPPQTVSLGTTERDSTQPYHVVEIRSVLEPLDTRTR